tara:strand:+ start:10372 stop:11304 length:933 start_codon:yes stop_codon:yes gene_type:complete
MGKERINYEKIKKIANMINSPNYDTTKTSITQIDAIGLDGIAGKVALGIGCIKENGQDCTQKYNHPDEAAIDYEIDHIYLSHGNKIFEHASSNYSHELVFKMKVTDQDKYMFIVFFVYSNNQSIGENSVTQDEEFQKLYNSGDVGEEIDLSNLVNEVNQNAFFMNISGIDGTSKSKVILFEEPIKTSWPGNKMPVLKEITLSSLSIDYDNDVKYYAGGTYYTECDIYDGGEDSGTSVSTPSTPDIESPSIDWEKYLPYILAVACGILMILIVVTLGAGGKKFGDKFSNIITEAINKLKKNTQEGAGGTTE